MVGTQFFVIPEFTPHRLLQYLQCSSMDQIIKQVALYISETHATYAVGAVMGAGSLPKLLAALGMGPMPKVAHRLPSWFWFPCFLWELAAAVLLIKPDLIPSPYATMTNGVYLALAYLGGVFVNNVLIHPNMAHNIFVMYSLAAVAALVHHKAVPGLNNEGLALSLFGGVAIGVVFWLTASSKKASEKKGK